MKMILKHRMISILTQILVFKFYFALATDTDSNTEAAETHENRIVRPSGFAFQHISNHRPEIVYFSESTTLRVNTAKRWKTTQPTSTTSTTTTPRPFVSSKLRKIVKSYGSSGETDSYFSASSKDESSASKSNESGDSRSKSGEKYSESVESNESYSNKSTKRKSPKNASKETASTSTTAKPKVTFPPKHPAKKHQNQAAIFNQLPGPPVLRAPVRSQIDGYQIYEPYAEDHLVRPPPPPHYRHGRPYLPQPANYYRPRQNAPFINLNNPLGGFFRFPVYRKFYVTKPKEPPAPPPHNHHHPPAKKPEHPKKHEPPKKEEPPKKDHKSKEEKEKKEEKEEKEKKKESSEEEEEEKEGEEKENYSHSEESVHTAHQHHSSESDGHDSDEKEYDKSTSYKVHESHEKKDKKKYDDKGDTETSGSKKGHKSSEKKDKGAHDSVEQGFVKEGGVKFNHENRKRKGFNTDTGYKNHKHFGKGNKGEYDESKSSEFLKKENDKKVSKHGDAKEYGQTDHKYRDDKGDEYKKVHTYYDDADEQGKHNKFSDEHEEYDKKKGSSDEGGEDNSVHNGGVHWKYGHLRKGDDSDETKEWSSSNSRSKNYAESNEYENEDGHKSKKHGGYSWK